MQASKCLFEITHTHAPLPCFMVWSGCETIGVDPFCSSEFFTLSPSWIGPVLSCPRPGLACRTLPCLQALLSHFLHIQLPDQPLFLHFYWFSRSLCWQWISIVAIILFLYTSVSPQPYIGKLNCYILDDNIPTIRSSQKETEQRKKEEVEKIISRPTKSKSTKWAAQDLRNSTPKKKLLLKQTQISIEWSAMTRRSQTAPSRYCCWVQVNRASRLSSSKCESFMRGVSHTMNDDKHGLSSTRIWSLRSKLYWISWRRRAFRLSSVRRARWALACCAPVFLECELNCTLTARVWTATSTIDQWDRTRRWFRRSIFGSYSTRCNEGLVGWWRCSEGCGQGTWVRSSW